MAETTIEWTDATWNPVAGCAIISPGCSNCYAMRMAARLDAMAIPKYAGLTRKSGGRAIWTGLVRTDEPSLKIPYTWRSPRLVFVNSMSDLFHGDVPIDFIKKVWGVMRSTPQHTYQILTKRPERMLNVLTSPGFDILRNAWLGTSVESADHVNRLDALRAVPAALRFVSFEPLLGSVREADLGGIDWAIVGGESGPRARALEEKWVEEIYAMCRRNGSAFFFKQWGGTNKKKAGRLFKGQIFDEMPMTQTS